MATRSSASRSFLGYFARTTADPICRPSYTWSRPPPGRYGERPLPSASTLGGRLLSPKRTSPSTTRDAGVAEHPTSSARGVRTGPAAVLAGNADPCVSTRRGDAEEPGFVSDRVLFPCRRRLDYQRGHWYGRRPNGSSRLAKAAKASLRPAVVADALVPSQTEIGARGLEPYLCPIRSP
jgi:hypothetical protein